MTRLGFVLSILSFACGARAGIASPQREFSRSFASPRLEFLEDDSAYVQPRAGRYPWVFDRIRKAWSVEPETTPRLFTEACAPADLQSSLAANGEGTAQAAVVEKFFGRCASQIETGVHGRLGNFARIMRFDLDLGDHPFFHRVVWHLPGGVILKGLLALKGDRTKRPFVVVRLGIFGNVEEFVGERFVLSDLFEQGPANVLVLENSSGSDYVAHNPGLTLGGPTEGLQNIQIAKILRDPREPLAGLVGSLHFVGISLGGNGVLHAAALETRRPGKPLIDSFIGFCPVIHLQPTLLSAIRGGVEGTAVDVWIARRLQGLRSAVSSLATLPWESWWRLKPAFWAEALKFAEQSYPPTPGLAAGVDVPPEYAQTLWEAAEPFGWAKALKSPFLVIATKEDDMVSPDLNVRVFARDYPKAGDQLGSVILGEGFHCTLPAAYDWNVVSALLNGAVLANAKGYAPKTEKIELDLGDTLPAEVLANLTALTYELEWPARGNFVIVRTHIAAGGRTVDFTSNLERGEFGFRFLNPTLSAPEKRMIERWLHRNLRLELVTKTKRAFLRLSWPKAA